MQTTEPMSALKQMSSTTETMGPPTSRPAPAARGVERNTSGGVTGAGGAGRRVPTRRAAPSRSQSHRIGRPAFNTPEVATQVAPRTVSRNSSQKFTRAAPVKTNSFQRAVPNRASSTNSLAAYQKKQQIQIQAGPLGKQIEIPYAQRAAGGDNGDCDSVFTTASTQTLDSIMLRKKQIIPGEIGGGGGGGGLAMRRERRPLDTDSVASSVFDFDESLHTIDSIQVHMRHVHQPMDEQCDLSVFSESFASTDTYMLSDGEEDDEYKEL
jgi:hypothetical protein